jgi:hypothetical protein
MAYATPDDVATRWGRELSPEETNLVSVRLEDVERMIRRSIPDLDDQVSSGQIDVEDVVQVESDAVLRLARNPEGYKSETDGDYTYTLSDDLSTGVLGITDDEWAILGVSRGSGMFMLTPQPVIGPTMYDPWYGRRNVEAVWKHYKVIDWARQVW